MVFDFEQARSPTMTDQSNVSRSQLRQYCLTRFNIEKVEGPCLPLRPAGLQLSVLATRSCGPLIVRIELKTSMLDQILIWT
jgi:hypothetical protein